MVNKCVLMCLSSILISARGRPEPPYYYSAPTPTIDQNSVPNTRNIASPAPFSQTLGQAALLNQAYVPTSYNNDQQNYNSVVPTRSSYGTPILRTSTATGQIRNSAISPNRNYGSPGLLYSNQSPISAYRSEPEPSISIQKHIYVHVAPPDEEENRLQKIQQQGARQKHYKIIFVKVPTYPTASQYVAQQQALQEEKTLIYVLVKKPEDPAEIRANQVANVPLNKPEVYFIKYKARSEQTASPAEGQNPLQQIDSVQENHDNDSVVIESAGGRSANAQNQGYNYDSPSSRGILQ